MKIKSIAGFAVSILLTVCILSGCSFPVFSSSANLMHPPKATGDKWEIQKVIEEAAGARYILKYPQSGDNRSSITMQDLNHDETEEAVALLTINPDTDEAETHVYVIDEVGSSWKVIGDFKNRNNDINRVDFGDVNGDGLTDILVGWSTYSVNQNSLYCYIFGDKMQEINTRKTYTDMVVGNFTNEDKSTVITVSLSGADSPATGQLLSLDSKNVVTAYEAYMDSDVTKFISLGAGLVYSGYNGVFVDGLNSSNIYNTQILYFDPERKKLLNPVYANASSGTLSTARESDIQCRDFDNDGIIEVPVTSRLPYPKNKNLKNYAFQTSWSSFDILSQSFTTKSNVIVNPNYGYSVSIPDGWIGGYTASYNGDSSVLTIKKATALKNGVNCLEGSTVVSYIASLNKDWDDIGTKGGYTKITEIGAYTYGYKINPHAPFDFTDEDALQFFMPKEETQSLAIAPTEASDNK